MLTSKIVKALTEKVEKNKVDHKKTELELDRHSILLHNYRKVSLEQDIYSTSLNKHPPLINGLFQNKHSSKILCNPKTDL